MKRTEGPAATNTLTVLDSHGDTAITWEHDDAAAREEARRTVADLRLAGYSFFLVDGTPADEVTAGAGKLLVRRLTAEEVVEPGPDDAPVASEPATEPEGQPRRRGRPRKQVIATRPVQGG